MNINLWNNEYNPFNKFKILCWYERMEKIPTGNFDAPVNIALDICQGTENKKKCGGFNCNFCMSNLEEIGKDTEIPENVLLAIPEFYNKWGVKSICLAGHHSDPLMYKHSPLIRFLRLCNRWNIEIGFVCNGAFYTDIMIEEITRTCNWSGWSINAGNAETHKKITGAAEGTFDKVTSNIAKMSEYIKIRKIDHDIGYKFLITDDNYKEIYQAIKLAKEIGVRHFQIRPTELPIERIKKIDIKLVEEQIRKGLELESPEEFEVFGIREKFNADFTKKPPRRCIASPLGSTWRADGNIVICPDRRFSYNKPNMTLGNFIEEGLEVIKRKWGGIEHKKMIDEANKHIQECIRCTSYSWNELYENTIAKDNMDVTLI